MLILDVNISSAKAGFLDSAAVIKAMDRATRQVLSRFGAFTRRRSQESIRYRKSPSPPGQPPSAHRSAAGGKSPLRQHIYFYYDFSRKSVVVGPIKLSRPAGTEQGVPVSGTVPSVLERGGEVKRIEIQLPSGKWQKLTERSRRRAGKDAPQRKRSVRIAARPYMNPAFERELAALPEKWRNAMKG